MNNDIALQNLKDAIECLNNNNLAYFAIDGTLLGIIRENDFISYDTDIDLGVFMEQWDLEIFAKITKDMMSKGFILYHSFGIFGKCFEVAWYRNGIKIDFFFYKKCEGKIRFNAFLNGGRNLPDDVLTYEYDFKKFNEFESVNFKGMRIVIPKNYEYVLETKYGDWKTRRSKWDWAYSPLNLVAKGEII